VSNPFNLLTLASQWWQGQLGSHWQGSMAVFIYNSPYCSWHRPAPRLVLRLWVHVGFHNIACFVFSTNFWFL